MRKAKVLSLPETIKEKSTFRAKALCRESVGALRQELVLKNIGLFQKRPAPLPQKKMKIPHSVASHRGLRHLPSSMTEISSVGGGGIWAAFPQLMKISIKLIITFGEGVSINCIYYTKFFVSSFVKFPSPISTAICK